MVTKTIPLTQKDFSWVQTMTPAYMKKTAQAYLANKKEVFQTIKNIPKDKRTFLNTLYALERCGDAFDGFLGQMGILSEVSPKKEVREVAHAVMTDISEKNVDIVYDKGLYKALRDYFEGNFKKEKNNLRKEDILLLMDTLRDFRRMGFDLPEKKQKTLKSLLKKVSKLSVAFRKNINDYQDYILCTKKELKGLSERFIASLPQHKDGRYIVTLSYPHIGPFLAEAENRSKRKELAEKNMKKGGVKNLKIIQELVTLRQKIAHTLGYKHHADFVTETRMAKNAKTADSFEDSLIAKVLPHNKRDIEALKNHAKTIGIKKLEHYDVSYVGTHLKKKLYDVDPETIRSHFPLDHVRKEMFTLFSNLFSINIRKLPYKLWHKDVECFVVHDSKGGKDSLIGYFAMDMFPREGKFSHAAMFDVIVAHEKSYKSEKYVAPFSVMVCNFPAPHKKIPSLLSVGEVETLFHEFGHLLHMTLTRARLQSQAGANVAWDFVETPSQIMENWVWNEARMKKFSKQYVTGASMDTAMIRSIIRGKKFQNGFQYMRQLMFGKIDLDLHTGRVKDARKAWIAMNKKYNGITIPNTTLFPAGFGHLVGYDAGYYSYLWALVYACDAFSEFKKKGITNPSIGMRWRKEVLEKGSSDDEVKLIENFLGRKSNQKAFLEEIFQ